jgi:FkbM family methyltransferase
MSASRQQLRLALEHHLVRALKRVGQRERVLALLWERRRRQRLRAEAQGSDRLSRPAAFGMDRRLDEIIDRDGGFFIEAGANDGYMQSNTYWLERFRGWRGLLVEPMPELAEQARRNRPDSTVMQCALVPEGHAGPVRMRFGDLMSTVVGVHDAEWAAGGLSYGWRESYELDVDGRTLSALLDEIGVGEIDLLSLDIEGYEVPALNGLDLTRHAPRYVLIEIHDRDRNRPPVDAMLGERYVEHGWLSHNDLLYVRRDVLARTPSS